MSGKSQGNCTRRSLTERRLQIIADALKEHRQLANADGDISIIAFRRKGVFGVQYLVRDELVSKALVGSVSRGQMKLFYRRKLFPSFAKAIRLALMVP